MEHEQDVDMLIGAFAELLPEIGTMDPEEFDRRFHTALGDVVTATQAVPDSRERLARQLRRRTLKHLQKGLMNGRMQRKPQGYAGDYLTIDWIYKQVYDSDPAGMLWDEFCHRQHAAIAVRNRKDYLAVAFTELCKRHGRGINVLDLASGPCRDVLEAIQHAGAAGVGSHFHCVDQDKDAINYAKELVKECTLPVSFRWENANVFRIRPDRGYDLVWSAGLFDYLNDRLAVALIKRMWEWTLPGGTMIVGNFHPHNPTRHYMDWCVDWKLIHRTEEDMRRLYADAGITQDTLSFDRDTTGCIVFCRGEKR